MFGRYWILFAYGLKMGKLLYFEGNLEIIYFFSNVNTKYQKRKINMFHLLFFLIEHLILGV